MMLTQSPPPAPRSGEELLKRIRKLYTPIFIGEGEVISKWYGCSRWIPYRLSTKEPNPAIGIWKWRRVYYPIPVNVVLAAYFWCRYMLKVGFAVPPECYQSPIFRVPSHCPHCNKDLYAFPNSLP